MLSASVEKISVHVSLNYGTWTAASSMDENRHAISLLTYCGEGGTGWQNNRLTATT